MSDRCPKGFDQQAAIQTLSHRLPLPSLKFQDLSLEDNGPKEERSTIALDTSLL
jgi:hypothetical protein